MMSVPMYSSQSIVFRVLLTLQAVYSWKFSFKDNIDWNGDVTVVDLSGQGITEIDGNSIGRLSEEQRQRVRVLKLKDNQLTSLPDTIGLLDNLEELHLNNNNLKSLPSTIRELESLKKLDLGRNRLTEMPNPPNIRELRICVYEHLDRDAAVAFGQCKGLEKLHIDGSSQSSSFVSALMSNLPLSTLRELTIRVKELSPEDAKAFRQCKGLEKLHLDGYGQTSSFVSALMSNLPNIRELRICVYEHLDRDAAVAFGQCKGLEKLHLDGYGQTSSFVSALMSNLPLSTLRELTIRVKELSPDITMAFRQCEKLEKLVFAMSEQSPSSVKELMSSLPPATLRELWIRIGGRLSPDAVGAFGKYEKLEKLTLDGYGFCDSPSFVSALMSNFPNIRELTIYDIGELSPDAAEAFRQCRGLEKVTVYGSYGSPFLELQIDGLGRGVSSPFVSVLMPNLPNIRELRMHAGKLSPKDAIAFSGCSELEKLHLYGSEQDYAFIRSLMPNLPNIRELRIETKKLSPDAAKAFRQCERLEKLCLGESKQDSWLVSALMPSIPNIRELRITVEELSPEDAEAFKQCERLEKLFLNGSIESGCIGCILSSPHMDSLRYLGIYIPWGRDLSDGDKKAISEARERHVVVNVH